MGVTEDRSTVGPSELISGYFDASLWLVLGVCKRIALSEPELNVRKYPSAVVYHNTPTSPTKKRRRRNRVMGTVRIGLNTL